MSQVENGSDGKEQSFLRRTGNKLHSLGAAAARGWNNFWSNGDKVAPENKAKPSIPSTDNEKPADAPVAKLTLEELVANYNEAVIGGADKDVLLKMTDEIDALAEERKKFPLSPEMAVMNYEQAVQAKDAIGENAIAKFGAVVENAFFLSEKRGEKPSAEDKEKYASLLGKVGLNEGKKERIPQRPQEAPEKYHREEVKRTEKVAKKPEEPKSKGGEMLDDLKKRTEAGEKKPAKSASEEVSTDSKKVSEPKKPEAPKSGSKEAEKDSELSGMSFEQLDEALASSVESDDFAEARKIRHEKLGRIEGELAKFRSKVDAETNPELKKAGQDMLRDLEKRIADIRAKEAELLDSQGSSKAPSPKKSSTMKDGFIQGYRQGREEASRKRIRPVNESSKPRRPNKPRQNNRRPRTGDRTRV